MSGDIIEFDDASQPHVHRRKEGKLKAIKRAFKAARTEPKTEPKKKTTARRRKGKKKK